MKKFKPTILFAVLAIAIGTLSFTAFAVANASTPAEIAADLTGKTVQEVKAEKVEKGITCGAIAKDAGKLAEFKKEMLDTKKEILDKKVADKDITQEKADEILAAIEKNQANCDGSGSARIGKTMGACFGNGDGTCEGQCSEEEKGQGNGTCNGEGNGIMGRGQGSCRESGMSNGVCDGQGGGQGSGVCGGTCQE